LTLRIAISGSVLGQEETVAVVGLPRNINQRQFEAFLKSLSIWPITSSLLLNDLRTGKFTGTAHVVAVKSMTAKLLDTTNAQVSVALIRAHHPLWFQTSC
jgi:hypothetical protein